MAFRNKSVSAHSFAMIPRADIPRSAFRMQKALKSAFNGGDLVPILCEEVLPGDTWNCRLTAFCRLATPVFPVLDNLHMDTFFFFVPNRLTWENWQRFQGEQDDPADPIDYVIPQIVSPAGGYEIGSVFDYFGLPTVGQVDGASTITHSALPLRAYNQIFQEWFRDQNLMDGVVVSRGDGPDLFTDYFLFQRAKRHDYFTSCLPWPQKGEAVTIGLTGNVPVTISPNTVGVGAGVPTFDYASDEETDQAMVAAGSTGAVFVGVGGTGGAQILNWNDPQLVGVGDLSEVTSVTINQLRQSFQIQKLLERDARGGTRYTEILRAHFGVVSPDARLQRPEYLGGGSTRVNINPVAQTSATVTGGETDSPQGNLAAFGTAVASGHGFSQSFTEHGYVIGLVNVRADLTYSQGLRRHWSRETRYDFYMPVFAMLGEQAVLSKEIFCDGTAGDEDVFGYQERWAEYRYNPSEITGLMRPTANGNISAWHYSVEFATRPVLNDEFIVDSAQAAISRTTAVGENANGQQLLFDGFYDIRIARAMPLYSVPGLIDHF